jgi:hypothetical protein
MPKILTTAKKYSVDPKKMIIELCKINKTDAPNILLEKIAKNLQESEKTTGIVPMHDKYHGEEQD